MLHASRRTPPSRAGLSLLLVQHPAGRLQGSVVFASLPPPDRLPSLLPSRPPRSRPSPHCPPRRASPAPSSTTLPAARCTKLTCGRLKSWSAALRRRARALRLAPAHSTPVSARAALACVEHEGQSRASQPAERFPAGAASHAACFPARDTIASCRPSAARAGPRGPSGACSRRRRRQFGARRKADATGAATKEHRTAAQRTPHALS